MQQNDIEFALSLIETNAELGKPDRFLAVPANILHGAVAESGEASIESALQNREFACDFARMLPECDKDGVFQVPDAGALKSLLRNIVYVSRHNSTTQITQLTPSYILGSRNMGKDTELLLVGASAQSKPINLVRVATKKAEKLLSPDHTPILGDEQVLQTYDKSSRKFIVDRSIALGYGRALRLKGGRPFLDPGEFIGAQIATVGLINIAYLGRIPRALMVGRNKLVGGNMNAIPDDVLREFDVPQNALRLAIEFGKTDQLKNLYEQYKNQ